MSKITMLKKLNHTQIIAISCIVLLVGVGGFAVAQTTTVIEDFEDGDTGIYSGGSIITENAMEGNYSIQNPQGPTTLFDPAQEQISFYYRQDTHPDDNIVTMMYDSNDDASHGIAFTPEGTVYDTTSTASYGPALFSFDVGTTYYFDYNLTADTLQVYNSTDWSTIYDGGVQEGGNGEVVKFDHFNFGNADFSLDYIRAGDALRPGTPSIAGNVTNTNGNPIANATINVSQNNETVASTTTDNNGTYSALALPGEYNVTANHENYIAQTELVNHTNNGTELNFQLENKSQLFEFNTNNWMEHGSSQPYTAYFHGGDSPYRESVTDNTTVISENTTVVAVDNTTHRLISTENYDIQTRVNVSASYTRDGETYNQTTTITVANRTIDNIEIMPSEQWVPTVLGFGEEGTAFGLGSEIQWLFVAIFTGASAAWMARNEWVGIGVIIACNLLFWPLGNVGLDIVLVSVFYGVFAGYQLNKIPSRSDTNVGGGLNEQQNNNGPPR